MLPAELLYGVMLPGLLCAALAVMARRPWRADLDLRRRTPWAWGAWGICLGVAGAVVVAAAGLRGIRLRPIDAAEWLPHLMVLSAGAALLSPLLGERRFVLHGVRVLVGVLAALACVGWKFKHDWSTGAGALWIALLGLAVALLWGSISALGRDDRAVPATFALGFVGAAAALCLGLTGSKSLAELAGAGAVAVGACFVLLYWRRAGAIGAPAAAPLGVLLGASLMMGVALSDLPIVAAALLWVAIPQSALAALLTQRGMGWRGSVLLVAMALIPALIAVIMAIARFEPDPYAAGHARDEVRVTSTFCRAAACPSAA